MCERIGHRPLRGRCQKRNARGKKKRNKMIREEKMVEQKSSTYRQTDRLTERHTEERLHDL